MKSKRRHYSIIFPAMLIFFIMAMVGSVSALDFNLGKDTSLTVDTTLTYAAGWRAENPDKSKLGKYNTAASNADDGNENFDQWDMINNKVSAVIDIDLRYTTFGIFLRPRAFYDRAYMTDNSNDSPDTHNKYYLYNLLYGGAFGTVKNDEFDEETEDVHGRVAELLDAFAYANFNVAGQSASLRVGRQVIAWGESLLLLGGISSAQSPLDVTISSTPGAEIKELFLPTEAVYIQMGITENLALSAYYQWKWEKYRLNEVGAFFSYTDMLDKAGLVILPGLLRAPDDEPSDSGQFGVSLSYVWSWLNETEFTFCYINYHEKAPQLRFDILAPVPNYYLTFDEDVKLYGASFSSIIGDANVSGEISYREGITVRVQDHELMPGVPMYKADANIM